jgi:hypothetical protein
VFVYLGMTVFGLRDIRHEFDIGFVLWSFFGCVLSRALVVLTLSWVRLQITLLMLYAVHAVYLHGCSYSM